MGPGGKVILFADDEIIFLIFVKTILEESGYRVIVAQNGDEALKLFKQNCQDISLAIVDLIMPGLNGLEVMDEIHKISPHTPVIISSSHSSDYVEESAGRNLSYFMPKNCSTEEIRAFVRNAIGHPKDQ